MKCLECGKELQQSIGKREKKFCNSTCGSNFWQKQQTKTADGKPKNKPTEPPILHNDTMTSKMDEIFNKLLNDKK